MTQIISTFCDEVYANGTFKYIPPPGFPQSSDCEPTWYGKNGTVLGYETSWVQDFCETGIQLVIRCLASEETYKYIFQVSNRTRPHDLVGSTNGTIRGNDVVNRREHRCWLVIVLLVLVLVLVLCCVCRKLICSSDSDGDNADCPNVVAVMSPLKNITPKNEGEAQALNGHACTITECATSMSE